MHHDFYIRQLWDWKASADIDTMAPEVLDVYGQMCGWTLARAHARSGDRDRHRLLPRRRATRFDRGHGPASPRPTPTRTSSTTERVLDAIASGELEAQSGI